MKPRAAYRNEVKTRVPDHVYSALLLYMELNQLDSVSAALARIAAQHLLGSIGVLPAQLSGVSADAAQPGPRQ